MRIRPLALCLGLGAAQGLVATAHAQYHAIALQNPGGGPVSQPYAINATGLSVGYAQTQSGGVDAVLWSATGAATVLDDLGGQGFDVANAIVGSKIVGTSETVSTIGESAVLWSTATPTQAQQLDDAGGQHFSNPLAVNASGSSVGFSDTASGYEAVLWAPKGKPTVLGALPGGIGQSEALAINTAGQSVGFALTSTGQDAVLWSSSGTATVLKDAGRQGVSGAVAIDAKGQAVGYSATASGQDAVFWSITGKPTVLSDLGGQGFDQALAMNNAGRSVGFSTTASGQDAVLWTAKGVATMLQDLGGQGFDQPAAINASGQSVGYTLTASGQDDAVLWSPTGVATDLGAILGPGWTNTLAVGLANNGDIIGYGDFNGAIAGFLLVDSPAAAFRVAAAPELSTWVMAVAGFTGLGLMGRRRRRQTLSIFGSASA